MLLVVLLVLVSGLGLAGSAEPGGSEGVLSAAPLGVRAVGRGPALADPVENPRLVDDGTGSSVEVAVAAVAVPGPPPDLRGFPGPFARSADVLPAPTGLECLVTTRTIEFSWDAVTGATGYTAKVQLAVPNSTQTSKLTTGTEVTFTGLTASTRYYVSVHSNVGDAAQHYSGVYCTTGSSILSAPTNLRCSSTTTSIVFSWNAVAGATGYQARLLDGLPGTVLARRTTTATSVTFSGLAPTTVYHVSARTVRGNQTQHWTGRFCGTATAAIDPDDPTCGTLTHSSVEVGWAAEAGVTKWYVARASGESHTDGRQLAAATLESTFTALSPNTAYTFILWWWGVGSTAWTRVGDVSCTTASIPAPQRLTCTAAADTLAVSWDSVTGASKYQVSKDAGATWVDKATTRNHTFAGLTAATQYTIAARAGKTTGTGANATTTWGPNTTKTCTTTALAAAAAVPASPVAHCAAATTTSVSWTWAAVDGATSYEYRYHSPSSFGSWTSTTALSHTRSGLRAGRGSRFHVRAVNSAGQSGHDYQYCHTRPSAASPPTPGQPKPRCDATNTEIAYTWQPVLYASHYEIQHAANSYRWVRLDDPDNTTDDNTTSFTVTGQRQQSKPFFAVRAVNATGAGNTHRSDCRTLANPPTGLTATCAASGATAPAISASWSALAGAEKYQTVLRRLDPLPDGNLRTDAASTVGNSVRSLTANGLHGKAYQVQARALVSGNWTAYTDPVAVVCPMAVACAVSEGSIRVAWSEVYGATRYRVSRSSDWVDASGTAHLFTGLNASTTYAIRVQSGNADSWGAIASTSCATTAPLLLAPAGLRCATTPTSITLSWNSVTGAGGYTARVSAGPQGAVTTTGTSAEFTGLDPSRDYYVNVHANKSSAPQHASGATCTTTAFLRAPQDLDCAAAATSITFSWGQVPGASGYTAKVQQAAPGSTQTAQSTITRSATFNNLSQGTEYYVSVHANKGSMAQHFSGMRCATTPAAPADVRCSVAASSMAITWDHAAGASKYRVTRSATPNADAAWEDSAGTSHQLFGLTASTSYAIKVQAGSSGGWGGTASKTCSTTAASTVPSTCAGSSSNSHCLDSNDTITYTLPTSGRGSPSSTRSPVTLKRLIAKSDVSATLSDNSTITIVRAGEKGGYVENDSNIRSGGWAYPGARVLGSAQIHGGGAVSGNALVSGSAQVYGGAFVGGNARVGGQAKIYDHALVYGDAMVGGSARIHGFGTRVYGKARVCDSTSPVTGRAHPCNLAHVRGSARVHGDAKVYGSALVGPIRANGSGPEISGYASVYGNANINGVAIVRGFARVYDYAEVGGNAVVYGNATVRGNDDSHGRTHQSGDDSDDRGGRVIGFSRVFGSADISDNATIDGAYSPTKAAEVFGNATVHGKATISGYAKAFGKADIYRNARVRGEAQVFDTAQVYGNAQVYGHARIFSYAASSEVTGKRNIDAGEELTYRAVFDTNDPARKFWNNSLYLTVSHIIENFPAVIELRISKIRTVQLRNAEWDESTMGDSRPMPLTPTKIYGSAIIFGDSHIWGGSQVFGTARIRDNIRISGGSNVFAGTWCGALWMNSQIEGVSGTFGCPTGGKPVTFSKIGCFAGSGLAVAMGWSAIPSLALATACFFIS